MKVLLLGIDITNSSCNPALYYEKDSLDYVKAQHLEKTAARIAEFTDDVRDDCDAVAWTRQEVQTGPDHDPIPYSAEEYKFHHVRPSPFEDTLLPKTQMSAVPEHQAYFKGLKDDGFDTVILTGFYASMCVRETMDSLIEAGFNVIVPTDLVADIDNKHVMHAFDDMAQEIFHEQAIFSDSESVANMILTPTQDRVRLVSRYSFEDINALAYGPF